MIVPFSYEHFAKDDKFFGRGEEIDKINSIISTSNNILLFSKRRMGKSSLIKKIFEKQENTICIYTDIFDITSAQEFALYLLTAIAKEQKGDIKQTITKLGKLFKRVTFGIHVDPTTADISYTPKLNDLNFKDTMEEVFLSLFQLAKTKKVILAIDEFQQISLFKDMRIDATLRKYIQEEHNISYIFLGSKRHILNELFMYKSPLFEMATPMELGAIKNIDIFNYVQQYLDISYETVEYIIDLSDGETKLIQHLFHILYRDYKDTQVIDSIYVDIALKEILNAKSSTYCVLFDTLTLPQKKAFKVLTSQNKNYFKKDTLKKYDILKTSLDSAFKQLFKKELIDKTNGKYFVPDRAFELWGRDMLNA